ncbi:hypothetical protein HN385_05530 [archaeon]|jgi:hypothetical protein|nr:hypothetical protein [archaeon]MBT3450541.1 hypothetical protein [archaeon]MBT6868513.1 hypothetical protein [archaeon]MBT7193047.1 hypothetical protein [archaeon]MBT7381136.1 hypothetical protein [archaeon]
MVEASFTSGERELVINNRQIRYSGIFSVNELFDAINDALQEKGYTLREKKSEETVTESGKNYFLELRPYKSLSAYAELLIKIKINLNNVTDSIQEHEDSKRKFQKGDISIAIDSWVITDYEHRWMMKPFTWFMKAFVNKYVYRFSFEAAFPGILAGDTAHLCGSIRGLLASYRRKDKTYMFEKDVRERAKEEMIEEADRRKNQPENDNNSKVDV